MFAASSKAEVPKILGLSSKLKQMPNKPAEQPYGLQSAESIEFFYNAIKSL